MYSVWFIEDSLWAIRHRFQEASGRSRSSRTCWLEKSLLWPPRRRNMEKLALPTPHNVSTLWGLSGIHAAVLSSGLSCTDTFQISWLPPC